MNADTTPSALAILDAVIADLTRLGGHGSVEQLHIVRVALVNVTDDREYLLRALDAQLAAALSDRNSWRDRVNELARLTPPPRIASATPTP